MSNRITKALLAIIDNDEHLYRLRSKIELSSSQSVDNIAAWVHYKFPFGFEGYPHSSFHLIDFQYMRDFWAGVLPSYQSEAENPTMKLSVLLTSKGCEDCPYAFPTRLLSRFRIDRPLECDHPQAHLHCKEDNRVASMPDRPEWCPLMGSEKDSKDT